MTITPYLSGQHVTGQRLAFPVVYQEQINGGPTSGGTEFTLASITVPDQGVPTVQIPSASWSGTTDSDGGSAYWLLRLRDTDASGDLRGVSRAQLNGSGSAVIPFDIPWAEARSVASGGSATYVVTITRVTGSGTIDSTVGEMWLSVLVLPDPSSM